MLIDVDDLAPNLGGVVQVEVGVCYQVSEAFIISVRNSSIDLISLNEGFLHYSLDFRLKFSV